MSLLRLRKQQNNSSNPNGRRQELNQQQQQQQQQYQKQKVRRRSSFSYYLFTFLIFIIGFIWGNLDVDCASEKEATPHPLSNFACKNCNCPRPVKKSLLTAHEDEQLDNPRNRLLLLLNNKNKTNETTRPRRGRSVISGSPNYHIIFSTGCDSYQRWQSYLLFYSAMKVRQPGHITRIVSGCPNQLEQKRVKFWFDTFIAGMSPRFHMHIMTVSVSDIIVNASTSATTASILLSNKNNRHKNATNDQLNPSIAANYHYFNKPFGVRDWMMKTFNSSNPSNDSDDIIIIIDPDMILLKPLLPPGTGRRPTIRTGYPVAQQYGYGDDWRTHVPNATEIVGPESPAINKYTVLEAKALFPAGPPYMATRHDMFKLVEKWCEFVPQVHARTPHLLGEMYAYSLAAAHLELPHLLLKDFMVSVNDQEGEAWHLVDEVMSDYRTVEQGQVCDMATNGVPTHILPSVLHYCQRYHVGLGWSFFKQDLNHGFLDACVLDDLLTEEEPPYLLDALENGTLVFNETKRDLPPLWARRNAFMLCTVTRNINDAAIFSREVHCPR